MTEIRKLNNEDIIQYKKLCTIVYNQRNNFCSAKNDSEKKDELDPLEHPANWGWGVFEGSKLLAAMFELDYLMSFDGHRAKMSGISGVGTLPEARKGGHVRKIFNELLPQAYENGVIFSNLTPFNHDFYRKFGYEIACARRFLKISTGDMCDLKTTGEFIHIMPDADDNLINDLNQIHSSYIKNINHGIPRDYWQENRMWKRFIKEDPYSTGYFIYLWKNEKKEAKSYIKYQDVFEDGEHNMSVTELAFSDIEGLYGALGIVPGLSAQFRNFCWLMPTFIDPFDLIGDSWSCEQEIRPRDMTRIINVKKALELMRRPNETCEYIIKVIDDNLPVNCGTFHVETGKEGFSIKNTTKSEDLTCDILTLSQLVTGYRSMENTMYSRKNGLKVKNKIDVLKRVFTERPQHVTEYF